MRHMTYQLKLEQFEGPLDLLLQLIEDRKLDITRVSLAEVADQYIAFLQAEENTSLDHIADFLVVASRLLLIKSKALLPLLELTKEEEEEIDDLEFRLAEYKRFKDICLRLAAMFAGNRGMVSREAFWGCEDLFRREIPPARVTIVGTHRAFLKVLDEIPDPQKLREKVLKRMISLEERMLQIRRMVMRRAKFSFSQLTSGKKDKVDIIVSFLAVLELVRQSFLDVRQAAPWGEIEFRKVAETPHREDVRSDASGAITIQSE